MARFAPITSLDFEVVRRFDLGLECLFLFESDPAGGSPRVARARLHDLGESLGLAEELVELVIDTAREGASEDFAPGLLDVLAVWQEDDEPVVEVGGEVGSRVAALWGP